jgi:hypothetical protein
MGMNYYIINKMTIHLGQEPLEIIEHMFYNENNEQMFVRGCSHLFLNL